MPDRRITHVAIKLNGVVWSLPKPSRHHHVYALINLMWRHEHHGQRDDGERDVQWFLDEEGRFLTRDEAFEVACAASQIKNGRIIGGCLTSEDLW